MRVSTTKGLFANRVSRDVDIVRSCFYSTYFQRESFEHWSGPIPALRHALAPWLFALEALHYSFSLTPRHLNRLGKTKRCHSRSDHSPRRNDFRQPWSTVSYWHTPHRFKKTYNRHTKLDFLSSYCTFHTASMPFKRTVECSVI